MGPQSQMGTGTIKKSKKYAIPRKAGVLREMLHKQSVLNFVVKPKLKATSNHNNTDVAAVVAASPVKEVPTLPVCSKSFKKSLGIFLEGINASVIESESKDTPQSANAGGYCCVVLCVQNMWFRVNYAVYSVNVNVDAIPLRRG